MTTGDLLHLNATLNATAAILLVAGRWSISRGRIAQHRACMIAACISSALFFASYVVYHAQAGSKPFSGTGLLRTIYFSILIPHVLLVAVVLSLALVMLACGLRRDDHRHRRIARWTFPIWMFVSVTGVVLYVMLYRL